ncbi:restriction endonuclease type II-like protein [Zopfochytrium polystomum]|nr:restriction endonuclease type II-like protein [Zopfochytrium polystomum]
MKPFAFKVPSANAVDERRRQLEAASSAKSVADAFRSSSSSSSSASDGRPPTAAAAAVATTPTSSSSNSSATAAASPAAAASVSNVSRPAPASSAAALTPRPPSPPPQHNHAHQPAPQSSAVPSAGVAGNDPPVPTGAGPSSLRPGQLGPSSVLLPAPNQGTAAAGARRIGSSKIIVNRRQHIRNVPYEFGDIIADFQVGQTTGVLFLSLKYHRLKPEYIYERIKGIQHQYLLRIILCKVDIEDHQHSIRELTKATILAGFTLFLAWSAEEAARYLETFKICENKPPDMIREKQLSDMLTQVKTVNKTDVMTLSSNFGSLRKIAEASTEDVSQCPGFGPQKVRRLVDAFNTPFVDVKRKRIT